jgi:signal transduction histidine kinase
MNPLHKLSLGARLLIGFGLMIVLFGAVVATAYVALAQTQRSEERLLEQHFGNVYDLTSLRAGISAERLAVAMMMEAERMAFTGDQRRMWQILMDLIGNAVKFTDAGVVAIGLTQTPQGIEITVRDTGIGISQADIGKLFRPFSQFVTEGRPKEGSCLGLSVAKDRPISWVDGSA